MVFFTSSTAELVVYALNSIQNDLTDTCEKIAAGHGDVPDLLTKLQETSGGILESTENLKAFWSLTDKQAVLWALQNYSRTFGTLKNTLKPRIVGKGTEVDVKMAMKACQDCHMKLLLRVGRLMGGGGEHVHRDVPVEELVEAVAVV